MDGQRSPIGPKPLAPKVETIPPLPQRTHPSRPDDVRRLSSEERPPRPPPLKPRPGSLKKGAMDRVPTSPAPVQAPVEPDPMDIYISPSHIDPMDDSNMYGGDECKVTVTKFDQGATEEELKLYFEDRELSGGGPVMWLSIIDGAALVKFKYKEDAQRVLCNEQLLGGRRMSVMPSSATEVTVRNTFLLTHISDTVSVERIKKFLESISKCSVTKIRPHGMEHSVVVTFSEDNFPEFVTLQSLCAQYQLEGCTMGVSRYREDGSGYMSMDALLERDVTMTSGQIKFFEKYLMDRLKEEMDKYKASFKFESNWSRMVVKGRREALGKVVTFVKDLLTDIHESELPMHMAGIVPLLKEDESMQKIAEIEHEEGCVIDVQEGTYAVINANERERTSYLDSEGSSGGSGTSGTDVNRSSMVSISAGALADDEARLRASLSPEEPKQREIKPKELRGEFQIGSCRFVMKAGRVQTEDTECIVNITHGSDIEQGDIWDSLQQHTQDEVRRQSEVPQCKNEWKGHGVLTTPVTGQPFQLILHVNQKHFKEDLMKTVTKCLQITLSKKLKSIAFFSMLSKDKKESPKLIVDAINKFQKAEKPMIYTVRLVLEKMSQEIMLDATEEVIRLKKQQKKGFFTPGKQRSKPSGDKRIKILSSASFSSAADLSCDSQAEHSDTEKKDDVLSRYHLINADITVYIYSYNDTANKAASDKLWEYCQKAMPPKTINDERIKILSKQDIRELRSNKVEIHLDAENGHIEMRGFSGDVERKCAKLDGILNKIPSRPERCHTPLMNKPEKRDDVFFTNGPQRDESGERVQRTVSASSLTEDEDDIFCKFLATELRAIPDDKEKQRLKYEIKRLLLTAQAKYI